MVTLKTVFNDETVSLVGFVVLYYDWALTLPMEVERHWSRNNFNWVSVLFFVNRYGATLGYLPVMFQTFDPYQEKNSDRIQALTTYRTALAATIQLLAALLMAVRIYAMYGCRRHILVVTACFAAVAVCFTSWVIMGQISTDTVFLTEEVRHRAAGAWAAFLLFDTIVFLLTVHKACHFGRSPKQKLVQIVFRDGIMYYAVIAMFGLANIITLLCAPAYEQGILSTLANIICVITMNRLMLNLRDPELTGSSGSANTAWRNGGTSTGFSTEYITTSVEPDPSRDVEEYHRRMDHVAEEIQDVSPIIGSSRV